ncbi:TrmO family methyltransferase domain-containing protein [Endozoicomonas lisbonensis]|uniref:tRNA-Thr(GGU) m(6)t(6)A37 methyltransferase TsaA n=1 Tax=Endozoicomonas lisbonensis TaxID=3120522 RepID=A0ABV2SLY3_9GAMM
MNIVSIGTITTPYNTLAECPNNIDNTSGPLCELHLDDQYKAGIRGLKPGESIDILYWLHDSDRTVMQEKPHFRHDGEKLPGTFALRSPHRPNPIGLAKLTIVVIAEGKIMVRGLDCLNGTQIVDIKPSING